LRGLDHSGNDRLREREDALPRLRREGDSGEGDYFAVSNG
jgi:hypothetical protein